MALLLLEYYDKAYSFSKNKYKTKETAVYNSQTGDAAKNAEELIKLANSLSL